MGVKRNIILAKKRKEVKDIQFQLRVIQEIQEAAKYLRDYANLCCSVYENKKMSKNC